MWDFSKAFSELFGCFMLFLAYFKAMFDAKGHPEDVKAQLRSMEQRCITWCSRPPLRRRKDFL